MCDDSADVCVIFNIVYNIVVQIKIDIYQKVFIYV